MCKYYGYIRVSTETQTEKYGLDMQRSAIENYAAANGIKLENIYHDDGISGNMKDTDDDDMIYKRAALMEMIAQLGSGDTVIVLNTSRLWRSDMSKVLARRELMKRGAKLTSIEQPTYDLYSTNPTDYLLNSIMEVVDVYDRKMIAAKLANGRRTKAAQGKKPAGAIPFGYVNNGAQIVPDEANAAAVRFMFSEAQKGTSLAKIAAALNEKGIKPTRAAAWTSAAIAVILHNDFYKGILHHGELTTEGTHEAIISAVQFGKVQAQLEKKNKRK